MREVATVTTCSDVIETAPNSPEITNTRKINRQRTDIIRHGYIRIKDTAESTGMTSSTGEMILTY
jgi:hypothetical protein